MERRLAWSLLVLALGVSSAVAEKDAALPAEIEEPQESASRATVTLDGQPLFRIIGVPSFPAEKRVAAVEARLRAVARDPAASTDTLRVVSGDGFSALTAGDRHLVRIYDADVEIPGGSSGAQAELVRMLVAEAIVKYRRAREPAALVRGALMAAAATVAFFLFVFLWRRLFRRVQRFLETRLKSHVDAIQAKSFDLIQSRLLWGGLQGSLRVVRFGALAVLAYLYLGFLLRLIPDGRQTADRLLGLVLGPLQSLGIALLQAVPGLIVVAIIFALTRAALRALRLFFKGIQEGAIALSGFDRDWAMPTFQIVRIGAVALALVVAYPHIPGSNTLAFQGLSVFFGVVLSIGSSSLAANIMAGYSVLYRRAFRVGDMIRVNDTVGEVLEIMAMVTRLRSPKNELIVVPNSNIVNDSVVNYSAMAREGGLILHSTVGIGYETPWRQVEAMLLMAADRTEGVLKDPPPYVLQKSLGDFAVTYEINAPCDVPRNMFRTYSALHRNILDVFNEHGIQIMTPAYEGDPETPKIVPREKWFEPPASPPPSLR